MQPDVLILDEPTSQLDPIAAGDFLATVGKINQEIGTTVIITEHRLDDVLPMSDRAIVMDKGEIIIDDIPANTGAMLAVLGHDMFMAMPAPLQAYAILYEEGIGKNLDCPVTVRDGRNWLSTLLSNVSITTKGLPPRPLENFKGRTPVIGMKDVWFRYDQRQNDVVKDLSLEVYAGELFCMVGGNGTGKTTAITLMSGINKAYRGKVFLKGKEIQKYKSGELFSGLLGVLPQNPQALFVAQTVRLDLMEILDDKKDKGGKPVSLEEKEGRIAKIAELTDIAHLLSCHPYDLSGGEQQRAALAKILLLEPEILLLDEPTKGIDNHFKVKLAGILSRLKESGVTIVMVSHDVEFCGKYADRCAMFFDGNIVTINTPDK
ncbi:MAG: ATP-binding cassette domain-containing protein, partial [Anaerovorax sp.]